jgi:hypothetical protein
MSDIYVILLGGDVLDGKTYRSFDEAKQALIDTAMTKKWRLEDKSADKPIVGFKNMFGFNDDDDDPVVDFPEETGDRTQLYVRGKDIDDQYIYIRKLTLTAGGRRKTARTIRMKKGEYLREHHHLFRVLRNPTRRALNAELRAHQKELKERGLKGIRINGARS